MAKVEPIDRIRLLNTLEAWDPNKDVIPQFVWDVINSLPEVPNKPAKKAEHLCSGYVDGHCWGRTDKAPTDCEGDLYKCSFYTHHPLTELYELSREDEKEEEK